MRQLVKNEKIKSSFKYCIPNINYKDYISYNNVDELISIYPKGNYSIYKTNKGYISYVLDFHYGHLLFSTKKEAKMYIMAEILIEIDNLRKYWNKKLDSTIRK